MPAAPTTHWVRLYRVYRLYQPYQTHPHAIWYTPQPAPAALPSRPVLP